MKEIELTRGYKAIVDDEDYEKLSRYKWRVIIGRTTQYAERCEWDNKEKKTITYLIHREILGLDKCSNLQVDHVNHNGLDNRKENLRVCTRSQNSMNTQKTKPGKYGYKGVYLLGKSYRSKPFGAQLRYGDKRYQLGTFFTVEDAARAYDKKARELFGEYASCNFEI